MTEVEFFDAVAVIHIYHRPANCAYNLPAPPENKKWSGTFTPYIGMRVLVRCNGIGPGTIEGFFYKYDYFGIQVELDPATDPEWHRKQTWGEWHEGKALVFGVECEPIVP